MQIITGKTGTNHVAAADDRALHAATFGTGMYVLDVGSKFAITTATTNSLTMSDGELMLHGCHARIRHGENETLLFDGGRDGFNRSDLAVVKYKKEAGIESMEMVVYKGVETTGTPTLPSHVEGNILDGDEEVDMPFYKIELTGLSVVITPLFTVTTGLDDVYRKSETYTKDEVNSFNDALQTSVNAAQNTANTANQELSTLEERVSQTERNLILQKQLNEELSKGDIELFEQLCIPVGFAIISKSDLTASVMQYGDWESYDVTLGGISYKLHVRIA